MIEAHGVASREEIDIDTLEQRLRDDLRAADAVIYTPELICVWATVARFRHSR